MSCISSFEKIEKLHYLQYNDAFFVKPVVSKTLLFKQFFNPKLVASLFVLIGHLIRFRFFEEIVKNSWIAEEIKFFCIMNTPALLELLCNIAK